MVLRPILDYHYTHGHFYDDVIYPPWYNPPPSNWGVAEEPSDDDDNDPMGGCPLFVLQALGIALGLVLGGFMRLVLFSYLFIYFFWVCLFY